MRTHLFRPDMTQAADHRGERPCTCQMPRQWRGHDVPDTDPEAAVIDARILGETTEESKENPS